MSKLSRIYMQKCSVPECPNSACKELRGRVYCEECWLEHENETEDTDDKQTG